MGSFVRTIRSTVDTEEAFASWSEAVCSAVAQVSARPDTDSPFTGRLEHASFDDLGFSLVSSSGLHLVRTPRVIARDQEAFVLVGVQVAGHSRARQGGREAVLSPGAMAFIDSTRPYTMDFTDPFSQLVVKVPRDLLSFSFLNRATAIKVDPSGPGRLVADFLMGLHHQRRHVEAAAALVPHTIGLLESAMGWAVGSGPPEASNAALVRERVQQFVRLHGGEPSLDADALAAGCGLSRRSLYRALSEVGETPAGLIRRLRVARAQRLLRAMPGLSLTAVARECGFGGEAQFHRAFRSVTATTPGAYRSRATNEKT